MVSSEPPFQLSEVSPYRRFWGSQADSDLVTAQSRFPKGYQLHGVDLVSGPSFAVIQNYDDRPSEFDSTRNAPTIHSQVISSSLLPGFVALDNLVSTIPARLLSRSIYFWVTRLGLSFPSPFRYRTVFNLAQGHAKIGICPILYWQPARV